MKMIRGLEHFSYEDRPRTVQSREEKTPKTPYFCFQHMRENISQMKKDFLTSPLGAGQEAVVLS